MRTLLTKSRKNYYRYHFMYKLTKLTLEWKKKKMFLTLLFNNYAIYPCFLVVKCRISNFQPSIKYSVDYDLKIPLICSGASKNVYPLVLVGRHVFFSLLIYTLPFLEEFPIRLGWMYTTFFSQPCSSISYWLRLEHQLLPALQIKDERVLAFRYSFTFFVKSFKSFAFLWIDIKAEM